MKGNALKICLVDDNDSFREGIKLIVKSQSNWKISQEYSSGEAFYKDVRTKEIPDVIIMEQQLSDVDSISVIKDYLYKYPTDKVIAVTMHTGKLYLEELKMAGFKACINNNDVYEQLIPAIWTVMKGEKFFEDDMKLL
jgi:DNA-binding NarL/FixJ family response regulator